MPWLISPRIVRGVRLATTTICLPTSCFRLIVLPQAGADLPFLATEVDLQDEQLVGVRVRLAFEHGGHAQFKLGEIIVSNRRQTGGGVVRMMAVLSDP